MYRAIMIPLDGSDFSERAVPLAAALARRGGSELHLVHVAPPAHPIHFVGAEPVFTSPAEPEPDEEMREYLESVRRRIMSSAALNVETAIPQGVIASALEDYAQFNNIDLIVMSTHGRSGISRTWLGSIAEEIIRRSRLPVLLTRPDEDSPADVDERITVGRILVPLKDSQFSETIVPHAERLAMAFDAEMLLAAVVVPVELHARAITAPVLDVDRADLDSRMHAANGYLDGVAAALVQRGRAVSARVIASSHVPNAIIAAAEEADAGVIAMATHARSSMGRALLGSVADKVLRGTTKPVLLCRPS